MEHKKMDSDSSHPSGDDSVARVGSEVAHTPGPWKVAEHSWCQTSVYAGERTIAGLDINDATEETQEAMEAQMAADARLIAAAPELLDALRVAVSYLAPRVLGTGGDGDTRVLPILTTAIAKAMGATA